VPLDLPANTHIRTVTTAGTVSLDAIRYKVDAQRAFEQVLVVDIGNTIVITDLHGEVLAEHTRPTPGVNYVGNGRPSGPHPKTEEPSPKS
jgi:putative transposase